MDGEFSQNQMSFDPSKYVMIDWDETMSLKPAMVKPLFALMESFGFTPKIFTFRKESGDNSDIFMYVKQEDVFFSDGEQKKDAMLFKYGIKSKDVAFWIDDNPAAIVDKEDMYNLLPYLNS